MTTLSPLGDVPLPPFEYHDPAEHRRLVVEALRAMRTKIITLEDYLNTNDISPGTTTFTGLTDTPGSITAGNLYRGNSGATALEALAPGTSGNVATSDGSQWTSSAPVVDHGGKLVAIIQHQAAQNTSGGGFTSGSWQTRPLTTLVYNRDSTVSLSSNQFTLPQGDWEIEWFTPAFRVRLHQSRLYDITGDALVQNGTSEIAMEEDSANDTIDIQSASHGLARVSLSGNTAFEIQHQCSQTNSTDGFGRQANITNEVYTRVIIRDNTGSGVGGVGGGGGDTDGWELLNEYTLTTDNETLAFFTGSDTASDFRELMITLTDCYSDAADDGSPNANLLRAQFRAEGGSFFTTNSYGTIITSRGSVFSSSENKASTTGSMIIARNEGTASSRRTHARIWLPAPAGSGHKVIYSSNVTLDFTGSGAGTGWEEHGMCKIHSSNSSALDAARFFSQDGTIQTAHVRIDGRRI